MKAIIHERPSTSPDGPRAFDAGYDRLRRIAHGYLQRERLDHTLQPTALVHEAWLRLARYRTEHELSEAELALLASQVMRRVLTDHARRRGTSKRDGRRQVGDGALAGATDDGAALVLEVDDALRDLAEQDAGLARVVELRFFGGHTLPEIARLLGCSRRTVDRRWQAAREWLLETLTEETTA